MMFTAFIATVGTLLAIGLTIASIWASILVRQFSLPAPVLGQILSILLPILTVIGLALPSFVIKPLITQQQPAILSALSFFDTILLTLGAVLLRSNSLTCELEQRWRTLFQNHDANAIRGIQDRLECCGLRSVLDKPWPFPDNHGATRCRDNFGRDRYCGPLWRAREVEVLSIWVSVGVLGLVVKVLFSVLRRNNPSWFNGESTRYWRLPRGTITDHTEAHDDNDGGRYRDEPTERPTRRLAESDVENERVV